MRILYLTEEAISFTEALVRGGAIHVRKVVEGLRERGHVVHLIDWNDSSERPYQHSIVPRSRFVDGPTRTTLRAIRVGRSETIDVIVSKTRKTYLPGFVASRVLGVPHVVQVGAQLLPSNETLVRRLDGASHAARLRVPHDGYFVVCEAIREQLESRGIPANRIFNVKNAIDTDRFRRENGIQPPNVPDELGNRPVVGFIGGLYEYKGVCDLADAIEEMETDLTLLVAGDGPAQASMQERIGERVTFLGPVPYEYIPGVYDLLDVLVLPSHTEGMPRVILEAAAMETPIVATDVGGVGEFVIDGQTGLLCPPRCPQELAAALERVLRDETLRASLTKRAKKQVTREYSWERMYERYESGLSRIL